MMTVDEIFADDRRNPPSERSLPWEETRNGVTVIVEPKPHWAEDMRAFRLDAAVKGFLALRLNELPGRPERLADFGVDLTPGQVRALLEVTQGVGAHVTRDDSGPLLLLWNNDERPGFIHHLAEIRPLKWYVPERYRSSSGVVPRFMALRTETREWRLTADYFGQARYEATGD